MAYPTDNSVRQKVMENLVSTLEGIDGASPYRTAVKHVEVVEKSALEIPTYPAVAVYPALIEYADDRPHIVTCTMTCSLMPVIRSMTTPFVKLYDLIEDIRIALTADVTRGGNAILTRVEADNPFVPDPAEPFVGSMLTVTIIYRQLRADAAAAI